jgi:beta-glucosidase
LQHRGRTTKFCFGYALYSAKRDFNDAAFSALLGYDIPTPIMPYTVNSTLGEFAKEPLGKPLFDVMLAVFEKILGVDQNDSAAEADRLMAASMVADMPLRNLPVFNSQQYCEEDILILINSMNIHIKM